MTFPVSLPVHEPEVFDNSMVEAHSRCPRKFFYRYALRRAPIGNNFPINFGIAYHKYREEIDKKIIELDLKEVPSELHQLIASEIVADYEDPPIGHKKEFLNRGRLLETLNLAFERINFDLSTGSIELIQTEQSFQVHLTDEENFGGRIDRVVLWNGRVWTWDHKTTSRMGATFPKKFDVNNQMSGYTYAGGILASADPAGIIIEAVYNTKTKGPEIERFTSSRTKGQLVQWRETMIAEIADIRRNFKKTPEMGYLAWPQRTGACEDFGGCFFKEACKSPHAGSIEHWLDNFTQESEWDFNDPDKSRREGGDDI